MVQSTGVERASAPNQQPSAPSRAAAADEGAWRQRSNLVLLVFLLSLGCFATGAGIARSTSVHMANVLHRLAFNVSPSIQRLAAVRGLAVEVQVALSRVVHADTVTPDRVGDVDAAVARLRSGVDRYLQLPVNPGEQEVHRVIGSAWLELAESVRYTRAHIAARDFAAARKEMNDVDDAVTALVRSAVDGVEYNAQLAAAEGQMIDSLRGRGQISTGFLMVAGVALGLFAALLMVRQHGREQRRIAQRVRELRAHTEELEAFAGRVAHDIRGPLGAASLAAEVLAQNGQDDPTRARLERSLKRTNTIIDSLLRFARAGAKPDPGARTTPREVVDSLREELDDEAAQHDIDLHWGEVPPVRVACSEGAYLSLLGNLVRNAIKYMDAAPPRRISVNVIEEGNFVRTEVADTGPGIPEDQQRLLFEPYFRGTGAGTKEGLGLGLPTVHRLAEGHGGRVGVSSQEGSGSTFWFTLPRAGSIAKRRHDSSPSPP